MKVVAVFEVDKEMFKNISLDKLEALLLAPGYTISLVDVQKVRPLPEKHTWGHSMEYADGYNACLNEITGEVE